MYGKINGNMVVFLSIIWVKQNTISKINPFDNFEGLNVLRPTRPLALKV